MRERWNTILVGGKRWWTDWWDVAAVSSAAHGLGFSTAAKKESFVQGFERDKIVVKHNLSVCEIGMILLSHHMHKMISLLILAIMRSRIVKGEK